MLKAFWLGAAIAIAPVISGAQTGAVVNPVYRRAQTLVNDGNATAGRALVDSMIAVAAPGSNDYAEGVYWRAVLAATAADAEIDYKRIVVDYPMSSRVEDALIRLAQLEMARGSYDSAVRHLTQLSTEHPESPARGRAGYWLARALFDKNDDRGGCAAITDALAHTSESDTELRNQINYLNQRCANLPAVTAAPVATTPVETVPAPTPAPSAAPTPPPVSPPVDTTVTTKPVVRHQPAPGPPPPPPPPPPAPVTRPAIPPIVKDDAPSPGSRAWSVQIAAYNVKSQADAMVVKLKKSGYEARVDGTSAPFRVRIGKYASQAQAAAVQRSLKAKQIDGFVVQADSK
jgi:cell division septation protein DedD